MLVDVTPEPVEVPMPTGPTGDDGDTDYVSPMGWQAASGDGLSMKEEVVPGVDCCASVVGGPTSAFLDSAGGCVDFAGVVTVGVTPSADLAGSVTVGVTSLADAGVAPWGFHDVTLVDMAGATRPSVSKEELSTLRRQWPVSLVSGMSKRQTDLELMRRNCKAQFRAHPTGACTYCGRNIVHDMVRHVSSFHLDLGQLWRCPIS